MSFHKDSIVYRSGNLFLEKNSRIFLKQYWVGDDHSVFYITNWTFVHMLSGVVAVIALEQAGVRSLYLTCLILHTLWELWQLFIGMTPLSVRGMVDIIVDTIAFMVGVWLARKGDPRPPPVAQTRTKSKHAPPTPHVR
jgi:hypothetical protein